MNKKSLAIMLRILIVLSIVVLSGVFIYYFFKLLYPFIIATLLVVLINPIIKFLERKARFPRLLAILTTLLLIFSILAGAMTLLIAEIISGTTYLANVVPKKVEIMINTVQTFLIDKVIPFYEGIALKFSALDAGKQDTITSSIQEAGNKFSGSMISFLQKFLTALPGLISWIPGAATAIIFILLATFLISKDWNKLSSKLTDYLPVVIKKPSGDVLKDLKKAGVGFIRAQFILITITFVIVLSTLLIMQVKNALTISLIMAVVDIIPILGVSAVLIPWAIYQFVIGNLFLGFGLSILFVVVTVTRRIIEPKVLASSLNLDPLATIIALFIGFQLFGFLGLIIGPAGLVFGIALHRTGVLHDIYRYIVQSNKP